jgi:hypothetical protein
LGRGHSVTMSEPQDVAAEPTRFDPEHPRWLDARLIECRELLAYLEGWCRVEKTWSELLISGLPDSLAHSAHADCEQSRILSTR